MIENQETANKMRSAAMALLNILDEEQIQELCHPFNKENEKKRRRWYYTPNIQSALSFTNLNPIQQQAVLKLLSTGLSQEGFSTATSIMGLENVLDMLEGWNEHSVTERNIRGRDPNRYYIRFFGHPYNDQQWSWSFNGHHLLVQFTVINAKYLSNTPTFFGANPARVELVGSNHIRPLAAEEDLARKLLEQMDSKQIKSAIISSIAPYDIIQTNNPVVLENISLPQPGYKMMEQKETKEVITNFRQRTEDLGLSDTDLESLEYSGQEPKGISVLQMNSIQQAILSELLDQYINRMPKEIANYEKEKVTSNFDSLFFAWAGGIKPNQPHYYRIQGTQLLVEYDNTQNDSNHIHSVLRNPESDFAQDLLEMHYELQHNN